MVIDTEGAFRPERLQPIAERFGLDADAVLENVTIARAFTSEHQARHLRTPHAPRPALTSTPYHGKRRRSSWIKRRR